MRKKLPLGIKLIGIFYTIASIVYLATGTISFFKSDTFQKIPGFDIPQEFFIFFGVFMILLGIISLVSAIGLFKLKNWARITIIIISSINIIGGILSIIEKSYLSIINMALYLIIAIYLLFNKNCIKSFNRLKPPKRHEEEF